MTMTTMRNIFIIFAAALLVATPALAQEGGTVTVAGRDVAYDRVVTADTDDNGTDDRSTYYRGTAMVLTAYDEDEDGTDDLWFFYDDEGRVDMEAVDTDGDGEADETVGIAPDESVIDESGTDAAADDDKADDDGLPVRTAIILALVIGVVVVLAAKHRQKE